MRAAVVCCTTSTKSTLPALFPDLDTGVEGRLNVSLQGGYGAQGQGLWYDGRFELRKGSVAKGVYVPSRTASSPLPAVLPRRTMLGRSASCAELVAQRNRVSRGCVLGAASSKGVEISKVVSDEVSLRGTGTIDEGRRIDADGVATFAATLVRALAQQAPALTKLAAADGSVAVPFHAKGPVNDFAVELDPSFTSALEKARSGAAAAPFVAPAAPEPLNIDIPSLDEQFGETE